MTPPCPLIQNPVAVARMLPFYGLKARHERRRAVTQGSLQALAKVLQELAWSKLAGRMAHQPASR